MTINKSECKKNYMKAMRELRIEQLKQYFETINQGKVEIPAFILAQQAVIEARQDGRLNNNYELQSILSST